MGDGYQDLHMTGSIKRNSTVIVDIANRTLAGGVWTVDGDFTPDDDITHDFGSATKTVRRGYFDDIYDRANNPVIDIQGLRLREGDWTLPAGNLLPGTDDTRDLGDDDQRWRNTQTHKITLPISTGVAAASTGTYVLWVSTGGQVVLTSSSGGETVIGP